MKANEYQRIALTWTPEGKGRRGRPEETWRRTVEKERGELQWVQMDGWKQVTVPETVTLGEKEHKALFPSKGNGHDDEIPLKAL